MSIPSSRPAPRGALGTDHLTADMPGYAIDFTLTLPPEITLTESIRVRCKGRVVRVEGGSPSQKMAVAAVIDEYDFLADV